MTILELLKYNLQDDGALSETRHNVGLTLKYSCQEAKNAVKTLCLFLNLFGLARILSNALIYLAYFSTRPWAYSIYCIQNSRVCFGTTRRWNETLVHCLRALE
ncbi:hypothetical protein EDC94DRAFT_581597 [Helicostylum pulchrum]|nr:hypothetical protein EDC94DRAFT_581597 [Helicostylum pulchrum]